MKKISYEWLNTLFLSFFIARMLALFGIGSRGGCGYLVVSSTKVFARAFRFAFLLSFLRCPHHDLVERSVVGGS